MSRLLTLDDLDLSTLRGRRVLVRVDFNVPLEDGRVTDDTRLTTALPTLSELTAAGARVILVSHCGRPKGTPDPESSLEPVAAHLGRLLGREVVFGADCIGPAAHAAAERVGEGGVALLENLRFHPGETANDPGFAAALAELAEAYVGDAFGAAHRAHASVVGVAQRLERRAAGRLLVREVEALTRLLAGAEAPFVAVIGGAKISGKIDVLENLLGHVQALVVGGGMANTFLAAQGRSLGCSLVEEDRIELAGELMATARARGIQLLLPADLVTAHGLDDGGGSRVVSAEDGVADDRMALDIGPASREAFAATIATARTLFWNGPMGVFERPPFDAGTTAVARAVGACSGFTLIGGGETVAAARQAGVEAAIGHISTGGGASLELLSGQVLPGVAALEVPA